MPFCHYIVEGRQLASREFVKSCSSFIYICPRCGNNWAQVISDNGEFFPQRRPCSRCDWAGMVPGSIASALPAEWVAHNSINVTLEYLPREVLLRELEIHLRYAEKELECQTLSS